jgi:hypothetical protein
LAATAVGSGVATILTNGTDANDPTKGRIHLPLVGRLIQPSVIPFGVANGAMLGLGLHSLMTAGQYTRSPKALPVSLAVGAAGALAGVLGVGFLLNGPDVGYTTGRANYWVKTGEETYNGTCTHQVTRDGHTETHTYSCLKVRDIGYYQWYDAQGDLQLSRRIGSSDGYANLTDAKADIGSKSKVAFVKREGRVFAYTLDPDGPTVLKAVRPTHASVVGFNDVDGSFHTP